jgi:periplasmic divalent cation tolerance protein
MTAGDLAEAEKIAQALVDERLAACVNIFDGVRSVFRWQGSVQSGREVVLIAKTVEERFEELRERVIELHSYELPCIVARPVSDGLPGFLEWIEAETDPSSAI